MSNNNKNIDVVIIGAGAAGMMCALECAKRGRRTFIIEHNDQPGKKIRISGGGRCNFTNINAAPANYLCHNPHFPTSALARYKPVDFIKLVKKHHIPYHEKKLGQLFCDGSAQSIIKMLVGECKQHSASFFFDTHIQGISKEGDFLIKSNKGTFTTKSLVVAAGGLSVPSLGTSDLAFQLARQFGISIILPRPGLVPLTLASKDLKIFAPLSGVSTDAIVFLGKTSFRENILFTHRGLSGPAILQISSYWKPGEAISINFLPDTDLRAFLLKKHPASTSLLNVLKKDLPARLCDTLCSHYLPNKMLSQISLKEIDLIASTLHDFRIIPNGTEGYAKAEVTTGGINTDELSSKTMESRKVSGLYFIGEAVDVTGWLGGYNFQWAWASGFAAGQYA